MNFPRKKMKKMKKIHKTMITSEKFRPVPRLELEIKLCFLLSN